MSRRRPPSDPGFGSDSFLDIIANIVGILIILIVVAGVRVSQAPVPTPVDEIAERTPDPEPANPAGLVTEPLAHTDSESPSPEVQATEPEPISQPDSAPPVAGILPEPVPEDLPKVLPDAAPAPAWLTTALLELSEVPVEQPPVPPHPPAVAQPRPLRVRQPSPQLLAQIASLRESLQDAQNRLATLHGETEELQNRLDASNRQLQQMNVSREDLLAAAAQKRRQLADIEREYARVEAEFIGKQQQLARLENTKPAAKTIRHELTPVARVVEGAELHFHLKAGKVAFVPLDDLVERMKTQVKLQKDRILHSGRMQGRVGPRDGFRLDYLVVREQMSALDQARLGGGYARVVPVLLEFVPEDNFYAESSREALNPVSMFVRQLRMAPANATLTFWVYPDSFQLYRELKEFAQQEGFQVAARPLQTDDVISASPWGTKSVGQ